VNSLNRRVKELMTRGMSPRAAKAAAARRDRKSKRPRGRPAAVRYLRRFAIGGECEKRWQALKWANVAALAAKRSKEAKKYATLRRGAKRIRLKNGQWAQQILMPRNTGAMLLGRELTRGEQLCVQQNRGKLPFKFSTVLNRFVRSYRVRVHLKRPYGQRRKIIEDVSRLYGISTRLTETCWDEYRIENKRLAADDS
jgi:hypothetical protein